MKSTKLTFGDGIGVFSPSSPISCTIPVRYQRGKKYLESKGFRVVDGSLCGHSDFYRSGSIAERAGEFNRLLHDDSIHVLMASIGGNNTNSILPYIDYDYLKQHPKIVIGYSDATALLLAIYKKTGLVTFYGPALAASFGELPPFVDMTYAFFERLLCRPEGFPVPFSFPIPSVWTDEFLDWSAQTKPKTGVKNDWICVRPGTAEGRLIGGNLNTMEGFFCTEYMPAIQDGDILLLEDSLKDASTIERSFSLLKLSGVFDRIGGLILGKHEKFDDLKTGRKPYEVLLEVLGTPSFPILADFDCCHTHPMLTMPIGCRIRLDAAACSVILLENPLL